MKKCSLLLLCLLMLPVFGAKGAEMEWFVDESLTAAPPNPNAQARVLMRTMTEEEKIGQMLMVAPEDLTGEKRTERITDDAAFSRLPVGGVILYGQNIRSQEQLKQLVDDIKSGSQRAGLFAPFVAMDEEGGYVSRLHVKLGEETAPSAEFIGATGETEQAYQAGAMIANRLLYYGINLDLAPVADVLMASAPELEGRSYGKNPQLVSDMAWQMASGLRDQGIIPCYKHFPGHGTIFNNAHNTPVSHTRSLSDMKKMELVPFQYAIEKDIEMIMISHLMAREIDSYLPASLSYNVITLLLRQQMGYDGVVITDALRMDAIQEKYSTAEATRLAIRAGADIVLVPGNGEEAYQAIRQEIDKGTITWEQIDKSVERIIALKIKSGLIQ